MTDQQPTLFNEHPFPVPARARSASQRDARRMLQRSGIARTQAVRILRLLETQGPLTRPQISRILKITEKAACGRLGMMLNPTPHRHLLLDQEPLIRKVGRTENPDSGVRITMYDIELAGRAALRKVKEAGQ